MEMVVGGPENSSSLISSGVASDSGEEAPTCRLQYPR